MMPGESKVSPSGQSGELTGQPPQADVTVTRLRPDMLDRFQIEDSITGREEFLFISGISVSSRGEPRSILRKGEPFALNLFIAVSELLVDLHAEFVVTLVAVDLSTNNTQLFYNRSYQDKLRHAFFQISFAAQANMPGVFRPRAVAELREAGLFHVCEGGGFG